MQWAPPGAHLQVWRPRPRARASPGDWPKPIPAALRFAPLKTAEQAAPDRPGADDELRYALADLQLGVLRMP